MADAELLSLSGLASLREHAVAWDDLWSRSVTASPTCRAELMVLWVERFALNSEFRALVVQRQGRWVAALPLVSRRLSRIGAAAGLPVNDWSQCGDLLLDESADVEETLRCLASGFGQLPWSLLWLDGARIETFRWQRLQHVLEKSGCKVVSESRFNVGWLELKPRFDEQQKCWSKGFRKDLRRSQRRLAEQGHLELKLHTDMGASDLEGLFDRVLQVDQQSWKAKSGTAIQDSEGLADFYLSQARQLAAHRELVLAFLELEDQPIAFEIGWLAKSVYHSFKVGFDQRFAKYSPGQLMMSLLIEEMIRASHATAIDCIGPLSEATERFLPGSYTIGRMLIANPASWTGRGMLSLYGNLMPLLRRVRDS
ncbi:GNAT family N-acetyltransferase [Novipirellula artificiosorum]|uniref:BioF2-like acetyltransferase domain-containing protein n=1 Tax=Novipirellula artificiosorum TaxID=2528016 RepID=A0A5C6DYA4_9BACT|nr:GNAT family N-acetyltransferase [Novipirellula artificiosorum]TWU40807.1 hypothetical protein Poly41_16420 [Novipirellula artificiosorum]